ncbi:MAG TPA: Rieske (2Fe-2S) protein [Gemmatimonas sp.]|nr:Rieske (2Fe-2S) protein [Gemmatimonas sp.]
MKQLPQYGDDDVRDAQHDVTSISAVDRRDFLARGGLLAVGALLASACGDGQLGADIVAPGGNGEVAVTLADYPALGTVGAIVQVSGLSRPVALVRSSAAAYRAFSMVCTHQGTTINVVGGTSFRCPNHGATFANSGAWTGGQRTSNLVEYPAVLDATGRSVTIRY